MDMLGLIGIGLNLLFAGFNVAIFCVIKFNDLTHLTKRVEELKNSIDCIDKKLFKFAERLSTIEGKCSVNHPN